MSDETEIRAVQHRVEAALRARDREPVTKPRAKVEVTERGIVITYPFTRREWRDAQKVAHAEGVSVTDRLLRYGADSIPSLLRHVDEECETLADLITEGGGDRQHLAAKMMGTLLAGEDIVYDDGAYEVGDDVRKAVPESAFRMGDPPNTETPPAVKDRLRLAAVAALKGDRTAAKRHVRAAARAWESA